MITDGKGLPLAAEVSAGQRHEAAFFEQTMNAVRVPRAVGRPRKRPEALAGDRGYDADWIRQWLRARDIQATIPERQGKKPRLGRPPKFDREQYRQRNVVERCVGWLKECRRIVTRFEKKALHYLTMLKLAMIERYLK